jgi:hypothetical protein
MHIAFMATQPAGNASRQIVDWEHRPEFTHEEETVRSIRSTAIVAGILAVAAGTAAAEEVGYRGWGPRVGLTVNPDQVHFGAHLDYGNLARHVRLQPNVEVGIGDDLTIVALNFEGAYRFNSRWDVWTPYLGGGPAIQFVGNDNGLGDGTNTEAGLNLLGGIDRGLSNGSRFFMETKLGLIDAPELKFTVGWTFPHGASRPTPGR